MQSNFFNYVLREATGLKENKEVDELAKLHKWNIPTSCPACGGDVELNANHTRLSCMNPDCGSKSLGTIGKFVNFNRIMNIGYNTIQDMVANGYTHISDVFSMSVEDWRKIGLGQNMSKKVYDEVHSHTEIDLPHILAGYNISGFGLNKINAMIDANPSAFADFPNNMPTRASELRCKGVSEVQCQNFLNGLQKNMADIKKTLSFVNIKSEEPKAAPSGDGKLGGKSFCFTGAASIPRKQLWQMVTDNGGVVHEGIKKNPLTDYLVVADPTSNSGKAKAARAAGVNIIGEDQFFKMCE